MSLVRDVYKIKIIKVIICLFFCFGVWIFGNYVVFVVEMFNRGWIFMECYVWVRVFRLSGVEIFKFKFWYFFYVIIFGSGVMYYWKYVYIKEGLGDCWVICLFKCLMGICWFISFKVNVWLKVRFLFVLSFVEEVKDCFIGIDNDISNIKF